MIATEKGWNLYVGGNGGADPAHAQLLAGDLDTETLVSYLDRFLMYYIRTADRLQRTADLDRPARRRARPGPPGRRGRLARPRRGARGGDGPPRRRLLRRVEGDAGGPRQARPVRLLRERAGHPRPEPSPSPTERGQIQPPMDEPVLLATTHPGGCAVTLKKHGAGDRHRWEDGLPVEAICASSVASPRWCTARPSPSSAPTTARSTRSATTTPSAGPRCWRAASSAPAVTSRSSRSPMHKHGLRPRAPAPASTTTTVGVPSYDVADRGRHRAHRCRPVRSRDGTSRSRASGRGHRCPQGRGADGAAGAPRRHGRVGAGALASTPTTSTTPSCGPRRRRCSPRRSTSSSPPPASA